MRNIKKLSALAAALALCLCASGAWGAKKKSCSQKCGEFVTMCIQQCEKGVRGAGGNRAALNKCKEACSQFKKKCLKECAAKGKK